jgi:hypothetical protein
MSDPSMQAEAPVIAEVLERFCASTLLLLSSHLTLFGD